MSDQTYLRQRFTSALRCAVWCSMRGYDYRAALFQARRQMNRLSERGFVIYEHEKQIVEILEKPNVRTSL